MTNKWDVRYLKLAKEVSTWSKDPSSQIGAVAIGSKKQVLATGYNGFPRGIADTDDRYYNRDKKYKFVVHAEQNVIYNATYNGVSLDNSTLYVWGLPVCCGCALGIIQVGVKRVVMPQMEYPQRWLDSFETTSALFKEAGVDYEFVNVEEYETYFCGDEPV
jgi:dCMP deaminase